jgi:4-carboxymuconolactone decarboxylase
MTAAAEHDPRFERGLEVLRALGQEKAEVLQRLGRAAPDLAHHLVAFGFGDLQSRPALDLKTRTLVTVCSLAATGAALDQLAMSLQAARTTGWTAEELTEALMQLSVTAGFPRATDALRALRAQLTGDDEGRTP